MPLQAGVATTQELFAQSDIIVVGDLKGTLGEEEENFSGNHPLWYTKWNLNVLFYLKGNLDSKNLIVGTPGAKNKGIWSSIDYYLDDKENPVLMFLVKRDEFYEPLNPQGILPLRRSGYLSSLDNLTGTKLTYMYTIPSSQIESYISNNIEKVVIPTDENLLKDHKYGIFTMLVPLFFLTILIPFISRSGESK